MASEFSLKRSNFLKVFVRSLLRRVSCAETGRIPKTRRVQRMINTFMFYFLAGGGA